MTAGRELTPKDIASTERLMRWWSEGPGLALWADTPHPWTTLRDELLKYVSPAIANGLASNIFHRAKGYWPGQREGKNPVGPG